MDTKEQNMEYTFKLEKETNEEWIKDEGRNMYGKIMKSNKDLYLKCNDGDWFQFNKNGKLLQNNIEKDIIISKHFLKITI